MVMSARRPGSRRGRAGNDVPAVDLQALLTATGPSTLFQAPPPPPPPKARPEKVPYRPRRGLPGAYGGRTPNMLRDRAHRGTTAQVQGIYPWIHGANLPPVGPHLGLNQLTGASFSVHPAEWLTRRLVLNPNLFITGNPGGGKSGTVKALAYRLIPYGVSTFVAGDLKNEYAPLARSLGVEPVELGPGLANRLNPLDAGPLGQHIPGDPDKARQVVAEIERRRVGLVSAVLETRLGRRLTGTEELLLTMALRELSGQATGSTRLTDPDLRDLHRVLVDPTPEMARQLRVVAPTGTPDAAGAAAVQALRELGRDVTHVLAILLDGALAGIFDGPTRARMDFSAPLQTVDLSRISATGNDDAIAMALTCVSSWAQAAIDVAGGPLRMVVRDEAWRQFQVPAMLRKIDSDLRLSRAQGTIQVIATHDLADLDGVGDAGSADVALAKGLISKCDIKVICMQDPAPLRRLQETLKLSDGECDEIGRWSSAAFIGRSLWKVGSHSSHVVQVTLSELEKNLFYTNERIAG